MKTSEQTRISQFIESQIDIEKGNHKIEKINLYQDKLNAIFWFVCAALIITIYVIMYGVPFFPN